MSVQVCSDLGYLLLNVTVALLPSIVLRPLPDFISQLWRKVRRRPGIIATSQAGNGGLGEYIPNSHYVLTKSIISGP